MAYTAPSAVIPTQAITASLYNTYVKDNILDHESRIVTAGPTGVVSAFAGTAAPTGWLLCDGSAVSQTTYAALYAVVGANAFGTDGGGNFSLPNLMGRTVIGVGVGTEITGVRGTLQGAKEVTLSAAQSGVPAHSHTTTILVGDDAVVVTPLQRMDYQINRNGLSYENFGSNNNTAAAASAAHTNIQPSLPLNYIIKF